MFSVKENNFSAHICIYCCLYVSSNVGIFMLKEMSIISNKKKTKKKHIIVMFLKNHPYYSYKRIYRYYFTNVLEEIRLGSGFFNLTAEEF